MVRGLDAVLQLPFEHGPGEPVLVAQGRRVDLGQPFEKAAEGGDLLARALLGDLGEALDRQTFLQPQLGLVVEPVLPGSATIRSSESWEKRARSTRTSFMRTPRR